MVPKGPYDTQHDEIQPNDTQHNDIQANDTQHNILVHMTLSITTLNTECHYAECYLCRVSSAECLK